jgi:uncharacterized membrane protein
VTAWWHYLVAGLAAVFLVNGVPHFVAGTMGQAFPTLFVGGPPNLDTPTGNVLWGGLNLFLGGILLWLVRDSLANPIVLLELALIGWAVAFFLARTFSGL